ncbi:hypothetical protein RB195_004958 [Necator americanus]
MRTSRIPLRNSPVNTTSIHAATETALTTATEIDELPSMNLVIISGIIGAVAVILLLAMVLFLYERKRRVDKWRAFDNRKARKKMKFAAKRKRKKRPRVRKGMKRGSSLSKKKSSGEGIKTSKSKDEGTQDDEFSLDSTDKVSWKTDEMSLETFKRDTKVKSSEKISNSGENVAKSKEGLKESQKNVNDMMPMNVDDLMKAIKENKIALATSEEDVIQKTKRKG